VGTGLSTQNDCAPEEELSQEFCTHRAPRWRASSARDVVLNCEADNKESFSVGSCPWLSNLTAGILSPKTCTDRPFTRLDWASKNFRQEHGTDTKEGNDYLQVFCCRIRFSRVINAGMEARRVSTPGRPAFWKPRRASTAKLVLVLLSLSPVMYVRFNGCWRCFTSERCECEMVLQRVRVLGLKQHDARVSLQ
jgi:hypothetical protein